MRNVAELAGVVVGDGPAGPGPRRVWTVADGGHTWPAHPGGPLLRLAAGRTSRELDATEELWRFFDRHLRREGI
ncbi:MAG TPA: hypothetical protein VE669_11540 [Actinomycetota bacterium]|jgi:poly(3-hydroxybutyrate) depolymerase|nr:hypothetical protein [Actinomycetota bacterium]